MPELPPTHSQHTNTPAPENDTPTRLVRIAATAALHDLPDTAVGFLYAGQPIQSTSQLPPLPTALISPLKPHHTDLLLMTATTDMERRLQQALLEANNRDMHQKGMITGLQSATVLQGKYDANFIARVAEHEENQAREAAEKVARKLTRTTRKVELEAWTVAMAVRKEANLKLVDGWKLEVAGWEQKRSQMKNNGKTCGWGKALPRPKMVPTIPKPGAWAVTEGDNGDVSSSSGDEEEED